MDSAHSQLEQQLQQIKKAKITAETDVDQTRRKQNEQDWLEEDSNQLTQEKRVLLDFLRSGWQGEEASGFHRYLEEQQHEDAPIECFHSSLKCETFYHKTAYKYAKSIVIQIVKDYIKYYNEERIQQKLGYQSPINFRKQAA